MTSEVVSTDMYQVMPSLAEEDFNALKADIAERGVLVPVEYDEDGSILDGHHRVRACKELGINDWPRLIRKGLTESEKRQHARQLNLARRHLNREQERGLIAQQLRETPEKSNRHLGDALNVSHNTVRAVREEMEDGGQIDHHTSVVGKDGVAQPARKPIQTEYIHTGQDKPLVTRNTGWEEWYTPAAIIESARSVLGEFDLDPASCELANKTVGARHFFSKEDDALSQKWPVGRIWMNPPFTGSVIPKFVSCFCDAVARGATGIVLTNNCTETSWFHQLLDASSALCLTAQRQNFTNPLRPGKGGGALQGQAIFYAGPEKSLFTSECERHGRVIDPKPLQQ